MSDAAAAHPHPRDAIAAAARPAGVALSASVFVVAACGLVYELAAGTLANWLLGDSVLQFSTVIGACLFAMGIGSYLSRFSSSGSWSRTSCGSSCWSGWSAG